MLTNTDIGRIEQSERKFVRLKHIYIDMAGGDMIAGAVLSEIAYWSLVPKKTGESRLRKIPGQKELWLACPRKSWWERSRIVPRQFDRAVAKLVKLGLVEVQHFMYRGQETVHTRLIGEVFNSVYNQQLETISAPQKPPKPVKLKLQKVSPNGEGVSPNGYTQLPNGDTHSPNGDTLDLRVPSIVPTTTYPNGCAAPSAAADALSPVGEMDDWFGDDVNVEPILDSEPVQELIQPEPVQEASIPVAPEPAKPATPDWAGQELCRLAVRYYFGLQEPKRPSDFSHIQKMVNFFTGKIKPKSKSDEWAIYQQSEDPLKAYEIVGFRVWFKGKYEDATLVHKPSQFADYIPLFRMAENYQRCCEIGASRLLDMQKAMQPAPTVVEPEPLLSAAPELPPIQESDIPPEFDFLPGETYAEYRARVYPGLLAGMKGATR